MSYTTNSTPKWAMLLLAGLVLLGLAGPALAQTDVTAARVAGTVKDVDGGVLPGATVEARNQDTGLVLRAVTDGRGAYRLLNIPSGSYTMSCELPGFATSSRPDVRITLGSAPTVDFTLQLAATAETITVTSELPLVEVTNTSASTTINTEQLSQLPSSGRNFTNLVLLTPETGSTNERGYLTISGQRGVNTSVTVDGVDYNNAFFGGTAGTAEGRAPLSISQESIKEFSVVTNGGSAEFGRSGGGFVNVITKSGTNQIKGAAFYYSQPNSWISSRADGSKLANQDKKQYGASLGGPIVKDKLFFFSSFDQQKQNTDIQINSAFLTDSAPFFAKWPGLGSQPSFTQTRDGRVFFGRFDLQANPAHRFTLRGNYTDYTGNNGTSGSTTGSSNENGIEGMFSRTYVFAYSAMLGDSMLNDLTAQYQIEDTPRVNQPSTDPYAQIRIGNSYYYGGVSYLPITASQYRKALADSFTYLMGDHVFKAGFDYNDTGMDQIFKGNWRGVYRFSNPADAVAGKWYQYYQYGGLNGKTADQGGQFNQKQVEYSAFIQDQWFISQNLTATLGLRWENLNNPNDPVLNLNSKNADGSYNLNGRIADQKNQWSPRLGLTWSPGDGKTVVRLSLGRFWSRTPALLFAQLYTSNGLAGTQYTISASGTKPPTDPLAPGWGDAFNPAREAIVFPSTYSPKGLGVYVMDPNFKNPRTDRVTLGFERQLFKDTGLSVDATWAETINLERMGDYNLAYATNPDGSIKRSTINGQPMYSSTRPNPYYGRVYAYLSDAFSQYYGVSAVLNRRFTDRLFGFLSVTWSKDKDNDSNERNYGSFQAEDVNNLNGSWGYSVRDQRWKFALSTVWNTPYWGISLSGNYRYLTGAPFTALTSSDANNDGYTNDRPGNPNGTQHIGRNTYRYPDYSALDIRLQKAFNIGPTKLALSIDCFNCTNNANWGVANTTFGNYTDPATGQPKLPPPPAVSTFNKALSPGNSPRTFQAGVRLEF
ncbi:MAG TPA: TonB-dependent receptor [Thermoanaerobaculaceae bacterium]|nr:TonB-dependent receptor [Thermoanaerobaculaceae bacterium]